MNTLNLTEQDKADMRELLPFVRESLMSVAGGNAVGLSLRTCALRMLRGQSVQGASRKLKAIEPTNEEIFALSALHIRAVVRERRH